MLHDMLLSLQNNYIIAQEYLPKKALLASTRNLNKQKQNKIRVYENKTNVYCNELMSIN